MIDWYSEAKARQQEWLEEANTERLLKAALSGAGSVRSGLRSNFMSWLGGRMVESGRRLQRQSR